MSFFSSLRASGIFAIFLLSGVASAEQVVISEIHYHPKPGKPEFIELQNLTATIFDIAEWKITNGVDYTFPPFSAANTGRTFLGKFERILVSNVDEAALRAAYPSIPAATKIYGPWIGALNNAGETIRVHDKNGIRMCEVTYGNDGRKWPVSADGAGHTLTLVRPNYGAGTWRTWAASVTPDGTPGGPEVAPAAGSQAGLIDLSEVHFSAAGAIDWVELHSTTAAAVNVSGLKLASALDFSDGVPLTGSVPGGGYQSWDVTFPPDANGNIQVFLVAADGTVLAGQKFDRHKDATVETFQAGPGNEWYAGPGNTRNAANAPVRHKEIVINEIMYDSVTDARNREFVELYNRGAAVVDLTGWSFVEGISYTFPAGTIMAPNSYLVVAADPAYMAASYGGLQTLGPYSGQLSDRGDLLRLEDNRRSLVNQVDYLPGGDWPDLAAGNGSSMELKHPDMDNSYPTAWADSDESNKAPFQTYTYTAPFQQVTWNPLTTGQELHMFLVGDSHLVVRNVSMKLNNAGANLIANPATMSTTSSSALGWVFQGSHWASFIQAGEIHIIADGHGDNKSNRGEVDLGNLTFNQSYTLTFDARWVSGKPRLIVQTLDHGFGTSFALPVPANAGTPGAPNSKLQPAPAPTISNVMHSPAVPAPAQAVKITARVSGGGGTPPTVEVVHRLDSAAGTAAWVHTPMYDDGATSGDAVANDGIYTGSLTQYPTQGQIAQFYVSASSGDVSTVLPREGPGRPAMFIKDSRVMPSVLMRERVILSQHDRNAMTSAGLTAAYGYDFPLMSNHYFNATIINNESEVRYICAVRKSGSPFTRDRGAGLAHDKYEYPGDRLFRERSKTVIDPSGVVDTPRFYDDRMGRYLLYQLGHPTNEMEFCHMAINGDAFSLRELHEPIANDFIDRCWDNGSKGTLLRIDDEWYFNEDTSYDPGRSSRDADWSYKNSDNPIRYHSEWMMRSREADYDYSTFIEFVRAVGKNQFTETTINRIADRDGMCRIAAVRGYDADWDSLTTTRGKNGYMYRPPDNGRWTLIHWDGDRTFDNVGDAILGGRAGVQTYFNQPYIRRYLNYMLTELLTRYTKGSARTAAWLQAEKAATTGANGVTPMMTDATYTNWFTNRETVAKNFIGAPFIAAFAVTTSLPTTTNPVISISGTSPSSVYQVRIAGQPWATVQWTSTSAWTLNGVTLKNGPNTITVEGVDRVGAVVQSQTFNTTKTGNSSPIMALDATPASFNVSISEPLVLDASSSQDPEGAPLTFTWTAPPANAVMESTGGTATITFQKPGIYPITVTGDDGAGGVTAITREATAYGPGDFSTFGTTSLENYWKLKNIRSQDNFAGVPWYSLQTHPGRLHMHLPPISAWPLGMPQNPLPPAITYVDFGSTWSFNDAGIELGTSFAQPNFDDSLWQSGPGLFGLDTNTFIVAPGIQTPLRWDGVGGLQTYYLRTKFQFDRNPAGSRVTVDTYADDGARFFLNGQDIGRIRLPAGDINKDTSATALNPEASATGNAVNIAAVNTDGTTALLSGTNVLAVDLHNAGAGSGDVVFGAKLQIASYATGAGGSLDSITHPWIKRDLPQSTDWILQTDLELGGIQFGNFMAGLLVDVIRDGSHYRYALGYRGGTEIAVVQVTPTGLSGTLATQPYNLSDSAVLRIRREGNNLIFEWRSGTQFQEVNRVELPAGSTAVEGGPFASTESPETFDALFDYTMLVDPASTSSSARKLVVSEVMYKPLGGDAYEYLELYNAGAAAINLTGYRFPQGQPFDEFVFPNVTIAPGAYLLVVHDLAAFHSRYGNSLDPLIAGEWKTGNLSNSGETITLLDAAGMVVLSFDYSDAAPWPDGPDTNGSSLVLTNFATGNTANGADYSASVSPGGSPGIAEPAGTLFTAWMAARGQSDPMATRPGDPYNNLLTYALGIDLAGGSPAGGQPVMGQGTAGAEQFRTLTYQRRLGDPTVQYAIEWSQDGQAWSSASTMVTELSNAPNGNGTASVSLRLDPALSKARLFLRIRVVAP
jgi:hypothetical protein